MKRAAATAKRSAFPVSSMFGEFGSRRLDCQASEASRKSIEALSQRLAKCEQSQDRAKQHRP